MVPRNSISEGFAYIWQSNWVAIIAMKTETRQIHFLSDVFAAIASLDLTVPITIIADITVLVFSSSSLSYYHLRRHNYHFVLLSHHHHYRCFVIVTVFHYWYRYLFESNFVEALFSSCLSIQLFRVSSQKTLILAKNPWSTHTFPFPSTMFRCDCKVSDIFQSVSRFLSEIVAFCSLRMADVSPRSSLLTVP